VDGFNRPVVSKFFDSVGGLQEEQIQLHQSSLLDFNPAAIPQHA
jgi:hypothetical protein